MAGHERDGMTPGGVSMGAALGWGALAASSLVIGVSLAFVRSWSQGLIGTVLAFGAGALIARSASSSSRRG